MTPEPISHLPSRLSCADVSPGVRFSSPTPLCPWAGRQGRGRLQRREWRGFSHSCDKFLVGEALANGGSEQTIKARKRVVFHVAIPEPEGELPNVAVQVLRRGV